MAIKSPKKHQKFGRILQGLSFLMLLGGGLIAEGCSAPRDFALPKALWSESQKNYVLALTGVGADDKAQKATGTLLLETPFKGPEGVSIRYSCGVTFISPHHAVTAAHCIPDLNFKDQVFKAQNVTIQMYRLPRDLKWQEALHLRGKYPNISHTPIARYDEYVDKFACKVKVRCSASSDGPPVLCDDPTHQNTDVALIRCEEPVTQRGYQFLEVAEQDDPQIPPYLRWTHELYQSSDDPIDLEDHYNLRQDFLSNFHYWGQKNGVEFNQILQLASIDPTQPNPYRKIPRKPGETSYQNRTRTDIPVCHGASGSGMLQLNPCTKRYELLGVLHAAGQMGRVPKLCTSPGVYSTYSNLEHIKYLKGFAQD